VYRRYVYHIGTTAQQSDFSTSPRRRSSARNTTPRACNNGYVLHCKTNFRASTLTMSSSRIRPYRPRHESGSQAIAISATTASPPQVERRRQRRSPQLGGLRHSHPLVDHGTLVCSKLLFLRLAHALSWISPGGFTDCLSWLLSVFGWDFVCLFFAPCLTRSRYNC
jgi:hypothetical protein